MTAASARIIQLQSYSLTDWVVTQAERQQIIAVLRADPVMPATIQALAAAGQLERMLANFWARGGLGDIGELSELAQVLGSGAGMAAGALIDAWPLWTVRLRYLFRISRDLHEAYRRMGGPPVARAGRIVAPAGLLPSGDGADRAPFGGAGATGVPGTQLSIPWLDQARMFRHDLATTERYTNPIPGSLPAYLNGLSPTQRRAQAYHLVMQPIYSIVPYSYLQGRPARVDVMALAGRVHQLEPALIAAFILAEQRDQSRNEDAKDYIAATNVFAQANTSIGLGQVVISTARKNKLFDDLLRTVSVGLSHDQIAELLVSEEFNIFAVARYLRLTADTAASRTARSLPNTAATYPGIDFGAYARPSVQWPVDNIKALSSEYTSRPWDDRLVPAWGDFVYQAYRDLKSAGL